MGEPYVSPVIAMRMMRLASGARSGANLTARESEVLRMLAREHRIQDIAEGLFLSPKTVQNHLTNISSKLQVETAAQAVAYRRGMAGPSPRS